MSCPKKNTIVYHSLGMPPSHPRNMTVFKLSHMPPSITLGASYILTSRLCERLLSPQPSHSDAMPPLELPPPALKQSSIIRQNKQVATGQRCSHIFPSLGM